VCGPQEGHCVKSYVVAKKWLRWYLANGITTSQVNLCCLLHVSLEFGTKFTWIVVIKIFAISLQSIHFLAPPWISHLFFTNGLLEGRTLFLQLGCFGLDFTSFCNCILCLASILLSLMLLSTYFFPGDNWWIYNKYTKKLGVFN